MKQLSRFPISAMRHQIYTTFFLLTGMLFSGLPQLPAQSLSDVLFSVATSETDADEDGEAWVYLLWQTEDLNLLKDRTFAIYSKPGTAFDSDPFMYEGTARTRLDPAAIQTLIVRGAGLGDDPSKLESDVDTLFENLIPDPSLPLAEKLSAVVAGCLEDDELFENLIFLSRTHPTLSLVLGTGFAVSKPVGAAFTFEVRECPDGYASVDACDSVVARLTVEAGTYLPLPAPGIPVHVPFTDSAGNPDPRAHLNVPLRWATPNDLRERTLMQFGYNLYRMTLADAEADNFDSTPPPPEVLRELAESPSHSTERVNSVPILVDRLLDNAEALNTVADPETYFFIDDNGRYLPGGEPFQNGEEYFYFVTARDILGRDGEVSDGNYVLICDRQPPPQPKQVRVKNHYTFNPVTGINKQHFRVDWKAPDTSDAQTPETISAFRVYRWWSIEEMQQNDAFPNASATTTAGGLVAILPASATSFIDDGSNAPYLSLKRLPDGTTNVDQNYANKTFWYTVRAVDGSACGGNLSGNSAPAYGVLRDRIGPDKSSGAVRITCYDIRVVAPKEVQEGRVFEKEPELGKTYLTFEGRRLDTFIDWVEFAVIDPTTGEATLIEPRYFFGANENLYTLQRKFDMPTGQNPLRIGCRMGSTTGKVSPWEILDIPDSGNEFSAFTLYFEGESIENRTEPDSLCLVHTPIGLDGQVNGIEIQFNLTLTTEEWKVYRRINDGRLTLLSQGLDSALDVLTVIVEDLAMPAKDARICYFVQLFDQHGNPSPVVRLACVDVAGKEALPVPMLAEPTSLGDETNPSALFSWFCPPYGVERFEVEVSVEGGELPSTLGDDFNPPEPDIVVDGTTWRVFPSRRIATTFPGNTPEFASILDQLNLGQTYVFRIRAVGPNGSKGAYSNEETFIWNPDGDSTVAGPNVPWPALGLPAVATGFNPGILARTTSPFLFDGGTVRIGELFYGNLDFSPNGENESDFFYPPAVTDPLTAVFTNEDGASLFPFVLYRYQVPNALYPQVSGDIYQVSPMMESIPSRLESIPLLGGAVAYQNYDPFLMVETSATRDDRQWFDLLMKDTQPVISGAAYRYLIVRFDPVTMEIAEIIPTNTLTIP